MDKFRVIVPRLNVRRAPVADFKDKSNISTTVSEGLVLELEEETNLPNPSLGKWYKDKNNQYYWEGGLIQLDNSTTPTTFQKINFNPTIDHWWITDYGVDKIWGQTRGEGVKIAIIDSGLDYRHSNIKNKKNIEYYNVINDSDLKEDSFDEGYHGTMCAGMIAAQGPDLYGVAPEADLLIIRATKGGDLAPSDLIKSIEKAIDYEVQIISISYAFLLPEKELEIELESVIKKALDKNILIVASCGNTGNNSELNQRYPAIINSCLSVGAVNKKDSLWYLTTLNSNLKILAPGSGISLLKAKTNEITVDEGTSFSTPFVAGICALFFSKAKNADLGIIKSMQDSARDKDQIKQAIPSTFNIPNLGIINPIDLFNLKI